MKSKKAYSKRVETRKGEKMLNNAIVQEVAELLKSENYSYRDIAKRLGISHTMVGFIQNGKRKALKERNFDKIKEPKGELVRCPECGYLTQLPCVYCQIKKILKESSFERIPESEDDQWNDEVRLTGDQLKRYKEVRDWRQSQQNPHFINIPDDWPWRMENEV